jgi:NADH dehydrogenase FAD-containing subunit
MVKPTLQVLFDNRQSANRCNIFALGDVAETGGPKMARAGMVQAETVTTNILSLIKHKTRLESCALIPLEGALKLSLGRVRDLPFNDLLEAL